MTKKLTPERIAALTANLPLANTSPEIESALNAIDTPETSCLCCGLPISEQMLRKSQSRKAKSTRKPVYTIESGNYKGKLLCKQCVNSGGDLASLTLTSNPKTDPVIAFREKMIQNTIRLFTSSNSESATVIEELLNQIHFGEWPSHMRAPNHAQLFWVLVAALKERKRSQSK